MPVRGVLDQVELSLGEVLSWREGSHLELNCSPTSKVVLLCGDVTMFDGYMGRRGSNIAIRVANKLVEVDRS